MKKQIKVAYFPSDTSKDKVLGSNGKSLDKYCVKCIPDEDLSTGNYIVDLKFLTTDNIQDLLQEEVILKVLLDYGNEIFRISKVTVGTRYIDVVARQITIADSLTLWLEDVRPTNLNGQAAVSWLLDKSEGKKEIRIVSDIDTIATAYYQRMSLYKALHDNNNSFLNRWGGEVQRRGYTIYINKRIGIDRGFTVREGKNLTGFESTSNIDKLVTRARGQGYNGILGNYIDSPLIGSYNRIYTSVIKYDDVKVKDEYSEEGYDTLEQAQAELDRRIEEEFSKNDIDKIKASYTINFVQLEKTEEYKNYIVAERLFTGDDCRVYIPKLNVDIKVRAISRKYDSLAQKTKETKLSNYIEVKPLSLKQITEKLEKMDSTETILQLAKDNATALIKGGLKNSYVIVRENEILIMDTKDINTATNVWRWNAGGLGHSSTGYYGTYGTAITQDGAIVADFITTGVLNAALIKTGILKSFNGKSWIDMENGTFNFADKVKFDGANFAVDLSGKGLATDTSVDNKLTFKVSKGEEFSTELRQNANEFDFVIGNDGTGVKIDKNGARIKNGGLAIANNKGQDVFAADPFGNMNMNMYGTKFTISATGDRKTEMWCDYYDKFILQVPYTRVDGGIWIKRDTGATILSDLVTQNNDHYKVYVADFHSPSAKIANLYVTGTKNCLQATKTYGERLINAYETAEYFFGDIGSGVIKDGQCIVAIDDILQECVNTNIQYHVFTQIYKGSITKIERYQTYFIVYGSDNTEFSWELKAKRIGYENNRFDIVDDNNPERIDDFHSILDEGQYEDKYKIIEVENVLDSNPETSDISSILLEDVFLLENVLLGGM
ncbi:Phage-related protein [uncultured Clostridium sp.]|uniref:phage tail spike protein n=1 Tax=uncultured Clostridium sp. TaxID=59620 RepID=UPI00082355F8|nr:phage tail spike protein [uncultured Clostridium sp.]SCJ99157.1 Phage-related protein [uncultured Clostridium sp.]